MHSRNRTLIPAKKDHTKHIIPPPRDFLLTVINKESASALVICRSISRGSRIKMSVFSINVIIWLKLLTIMAIPMCILYWSGKYRYVYLASKIPGPSLWSLVTVHAKELFSENGFMYLCKLCEENGFRPFRMWIGFQYSVVLCDPESLSVAFKSKHLTDKTVAYYGTLAEYIGSGSVGINGAEWKKHRTSVNPAFHKNFLKAHLPMFNVEAKAFVQRMFDHSKGEDFDVIHDVREFTYFMAWKSIISKDSDITDSRVFCKAVSKILYITQLRTFNPVYYYMFYRFRTLHATSKREILHMLRDLFAKSTAILDAASEELAAGSDFVPSSVLEYLAHRKHQGSAVLSDDEMKDELKTLLGAASETTATTASVCVLLLSLYPTEQQRVIDEVKKIFGESDRPVTADDLRDLECLERAIKETMRLFPAVPAFMRTATEEVDVNGTIVPKGSAIVILLSALHRNPASFNNPHDFIPDRFLPGSAEGRHQFAYLPFSYGARNCIGRPQAILQVKVLLATLFRRFRVVPGKGLNCINDIKVKIDTTLRLRKTLVRFIPLEHQSSNIIPSNVN